MDDGRRSHRYTKKRAHLVLSIFWFISYSNYFQSRLNYICITISAPQNQESALNLVWTKGEVGPPLNWFKPSGKIFYWPFQGSISFVNLLCFICLMFAMTLCASVYMCLVVTGWERADLLALVCGVWLWVCHFPIGILGQVWYLTVSIPNLYTLTYFDESLKGQNCVVMSDEQTYPGIIHDVDYGEIEVMATHRVGENRFFWPYRDDTLWYKTENFVTLISPTELPAGTIKLTRQYGEQLKKNTIYNSYVFKSSLTLSRMETPKENCTLANSEDPDERLHNAAFHQNLHRFIKDTWCSEIYTQYFFKNYNLWPLSIYTHLIFRERNTMFVFVFVF